MKKMNSKGVMWSDIKNLVLTAIGIGVGIYLIWAYLLHGGGDSVGEFQKCGSITLGNGICKEICSTNEMSYENLGCKGKTSMCCVRISTGMYDVVLPSGYGGNDQYDFKITDIDFGPLPGGCMPSENAATKTIVCEPEMGYRIPITMKIINVNRQVEVFADPITVINGNGDTVSKSGKYVGFVPATLSMPNQEAIIETVIDIPPSEENEYWEVYPYAKCVTKECRNTDLSKSQGILSTNQRISVTIEFMRR